MLARQWAWRTLYSPLTPSSSFSSISLLAKWRLRQVCLSSSQLILFTFFTASFYQYRTLEVTKFWRDCIRNEMIDERLYRGFYNSVSSSLIMNISSIPLKFRVELLNVNELKEVLEVAKVNTSACSEDTDYRSHYIAYLIFKDKPLIFERSRLRSGNRFITYPRWVCELPVWKASYYFLRVDLRRSEILESELCNFKWHFAFRHDEVREMRVHHCPCGFAHPPFSVTAHPFIKTSSLSMITRTIYKTFNTVHLTILDICCKMSCIPET